jgi:hypothetical protein
MEIALQSKMNKLSLSSGFGGEEVSVFTVCLCVEGDSYFRAKDVAFEHFVCALKLNTSVLPRASFVYTSHCFLFGLPVRLRTRVSCSPGLTRSAAKSQVGGRFVYTWT